MKIISLNVALGLICGNFLYQWMTSEDWGRAFDRSWFQVVAILGLNFAFHYAR